MHDYYLYTREVFNKYNLVQEKIKNLDDSTSEEEDEFLQNFCIYLAHALIKDTGDGPISRQELVKVANIILEVCK